MSGDDDVAGFTHRRKCKARHDIAGLIGQISFARAEGTTSTDSDLHLVFFLFDGDQTLGDFLAQGDAQFSFGNRGLAFGFAICRRSCAFAIAAS